MLVECVKIEKIDDIQNVPQWRYRFESAGRKEGAFRDVPELLVIKPVATAWAIGKNYSLEIA